METPASPRSFVITCLVGWFALALTGMYLAGQRAIPNAVALPVIAAFLVEFVFYLVPGFRAARE